jgi:hypothetical protein
MPALFLKKNQKQINMKQFKVGDRVRVIARNVFGLGEVVCRLVRWENCAKPVLYAGAVI